MPTSRNRGYSVWKQPMSDTSNPEWQTTDWRAVCGKTARTVRREGEPNSIGSPYPYQAVLTLEFADHGDGLAEDLDAVGDDRLGLAAGFQPDAMGFLVIHPQHRIRAVD